MEKLFKLMAYDMGINPYYNESDQSYFYRTTFSALGLWCLTNARSQTGDLEGISKVAQTRILHNLVNNYIYLCPSIRQYLSNDRFDIPVFIRNLYEQTGYLIVSDNNYNILNKSQESIPITVSDNLYLGIPYDDFWVNGTGIHCKNAGRPISSKDFLIRDSLSPESFVSANFNICDFEEREIALSDLEFFDARSRESFSKSWRKKITDKFSIARESPYGPYYKVILGSKGQLYFSSENINDPSDDSFTGNEYRRIYIALKCYYNNPMIVYRNPIDDEYTHINILGKIPNREYYFFLLNGWPKRCAADTSNFIMRNELVPKCLEMLVNLGFKILNGRIYG